MAQFSSDSSEGIQVPGTTAFLANESKRRIDQQSHHHQRNNNSSNNNKNNINNTKQHRRNSIMTSRSADGRMAAIFGLILIWITILLVAILSNGDGGWFGGEPNSTSDKRECVTAAETALAANSSNESLRSVVSIVMEAFHQSDQSIYCGVTVLPTLPSTTTTAAASSDSLLTATAVVVDFYYNLMLERPQYTRVDFNCCFLLIVSLLLFTVWIGLFGLPVFPVLVFVALVPVIAPWYCQRHCLGGIQVPVRTVPQSNTLRTLSRTRSTTTAFWPRRQIITLSVASTSNRKPIGSIRKQPFLSLFIRR
jgi:hypothetical protein